MADTLSEITRLKYQELAKALAQANIGQGIVGESAVWQSLNNGSLSAADFNKLVTSNAGYNSGFRAIGNADGTIRSYTYVGHDFPITEFTYDDILGAFNSNVQSGTSAAANTFTMQQPTDTALAGAVGSETVKAAGGVTKYSGGQMVGKVASTMGTVLTAVMAASTGIQLGKAIDSAAYNIGNAIGLDPPETLNPETWNTITSGNDSLAAKAFNFIFGLNPDNGQITAYTDEKAFAYMAGWLMKQGFFNAGEERGTYDFPASGSYRSYLSQPITYVDPAGTFIERQRVQSTYYEFYRGVVSVSGNSPVYAYMVQYSGAKRLMLISESSFTATVLTKFVGRPTSQTDEQISDYTSDASAYNINNVSGYYYYLQIASYAPDTIADANPTAYCTSRDRETHPDEAFFIRKYGSVSGGSAVDGVTDQQDATRPNTNNWDYNDPTNTILPSLQQQYPDLWKNRMENDVVQPDGSTIKYVYIPTVIPSGGNGTNPDTTADKQGLLDPSINPDDSSATKLQTIIQILTSLLPQAMTDPSTVPEGELQDGTNTRNPNPDIPNNPPDTGGGSTPTILPPTGNASSLWKVYHPSQAQVDAFGAWLWSSNFVEQIKKMFNDPMQSIIGLHKIFAAPIDAGSSTIKVGYLDSQVASAYVDNQYVTVNCGSVELREYFGNVFDYEPFTRVAIFLPFIGVQKLDVSEVMRSTISVVYHVDVFSGACLAEVSVTRDGGGGCLYTFSGDASARYPISSGSYMGIVSGVLSIAGGIAGTIATGGAALPAVVGAGVAATHMHTDVKHSGQISGNAGAMGGKVPYLIVVRPQTEVASRSERYYGYGANSYCKVESLSGFARLYNAVVRPNDSITDEERKEIQTILESGFYA